MVSTEKLSGGEKAPGKKRPANTLRDDDAERKAPNAGDSDQTILPAGANLSQYPNPAGLPSGPPPPWMARAPFPTNNTVVGQQVDPISAFFQTLMGSGQPEMGTPPVTPPPPTRAPGAPPAPMGWLESLMSSLGRVE